MVRSLKSRAPGPPGAPPGSLAEVPLAGTRAEALRRLQMGGVGVVAVLLLIGLASAIKDRATETESTAVAGAAATTAPGASTAAPDPMAEAGVAPEMPESLSATPAPANPGARAPGAAPARTQPDAR